MSKLLIGEEEWVLKPLTSEDDWELCEDVGLGSNNGVVGERFKCLEGVRSVNFTAFAGLFSKGNAKGAYDTGLCCHVGNHCGSNICLC